MQPKVSIIVAVYNVAPYLEKCMESLVNQTLKEIEIIAVNDCSIDNSLEILEKYAKQDKRILITSNELPPAQFVFAPRLAHWQFVCFRRN